MQRYRGYSDSWTSCLESFCETFQYRNKLRLFCSRFYMSIIFVFMRKQGQEYRKINFYRMYTSLRKPCVGNSTFSFLTKNLLSLYFNGTSPTANKKEIRSAIYVVFNFRLISYRTFYRTNLKASSLFMFFAEQFLSRSFGNIFLFLRISNCIYVVLVRSVRKFFHTKQIKIGTWILFLTVLTAAASEIVLIERFDRKR